MYILIFLKKTTFFIKNFYYKTDIWKISSS